ncbi:nuclear transport factor 2 family protein [Saccharospirillum sp. HFRX-1]|uniref:nuclear transport factor 2 family protein n=1 Tax=unclassified Saccharospirillum TaxID=2633430 RepID=UPI003716046E
MTQINRSADCGNSPKNTTTECIGVALETLAMKQLQGLLAETVMWRLPEVTLTGIDAIAVYLSEQSAPIKLDIDRVASHGKAGAVNGIATHGKTPRRFCHLIEFTSVKCERVSRIESYLG